MPTDPLSIFLLCENRLLREALLRILSKRGNLQVVGACAYSLTALTEVATSRPQVVLLDSIGLAVGQSQLLSHIHKSIPEARTLMVGMESKEEDFLHAVRDGASGYTLREASAVEVLSAIRSVSVGEAVCPPCFSVALFRCAAQQLAIQQNLRTRSRSELSRREQQLVELIWWGLTNKEIGSRLHLSEHTVKNHVHRILEKTSAPDRISLIGRYHSH